MTNEEKSKEIAEKTLGEFATSFLGYIDEVSEVFCECAAMKMAEWKDEQFIQILPEIFDFFADNIGLYDGGCSNEDADKSWFIDEFTNKILGKK